MIENTKRQSIVLMSPLPTTKPASSVKGFLREIIPRPAREIDMMRREPPGGGYTKFDTMLKIDIYERDDDGDDSDGGELTAKGWLRAGERVQ